MLTHAVAGKEGNKNTRKESKQRPLHRTMRRYRWANPTPVETTTKRGVVRLVERSEREGEREREREREKIE